ncbi:MAG: B12-binding domain-containing radical SAM protein, partial [Candidatus Methylomirabilis sp.]|nr:B12-binding domain-containing radical SAM protein [Deltaproteobacteria bacterium]
MKVFISYPPFIDEKKGVAMLTQNRQFQWFSTPSYLYPLVPAMAATVMKEAGHDTVWNDAIVQGWDMARYMTFFKAEKPDMVVFESKTPVIKKHWQIIKEMKGIAPKCKFVLMGDHVTAKPAESLEQCPVDYVFTGGNYDISLRALANHLEGEGEMPPGVWWRNEDGEIANSGDFELNYDLNELPFHDRDLTMAHRYFEKWRKYKKFYYTMVGRDCPYAKCTFCSWTVTHPRFKTRRPDLLLDEIGYLIEEHGAEEIFDDTGTFPAGGWLKRFCEGMIDRGYHKKIVWTC